MSTTTPPTIRTRITTLFRNRRLRTLALLVASYNAYKYYKIHTTLNKTFDAHRHRPGQTILDLDLDAVQLVSQPSLSLSSAEELRLQKLITTLQAAKADPRVAGLVVRGLSGLRSVGLAEISELRAVIRDFSNGWGGKRTILHVPEGLGGAGNGTVPLYFASAFDAVHVQPTSSIVVPGLSLATLFFKRMLDNIGVKAKKVARKEFKTAANAVTEDKFTEPHRESTEALLSAIMKDIVKGVAEGRGIGEESVREVIDTAIMSPKEAFERGIVDEPLYRDQLPEVMREGLIEVRELRKKVREEVKKEWRDAMRELKKVWTEEEGIYHVWNDGEILHLADRFETALPAALSFGDQRNEVTKRTTDAEVRALKAHVRWLDTCPWEEVSGKEEEENSVYGVDSNISGVMEAERRICENAIRTLEECPKLVESFRQVAEDESVIKLNNESALSVIRWCRGMWRAKCMAARMVGTVLDLEDELEQVMKSSKIEEEAKEKVKLVASDPTLFLSGFAEALTDVAKRLGDTKEQSSDDSEKNAKEDGERQVIKKDESDSQEDAKSEEKKKKDKLRYVKFADYIDTLGTEKRAAIDRSRPAIRLETNDPYKRLPGTIDVQERNSLLRLQYAGHPFDPWRVSVPKGDVVAIITIDGAISDEDADVTRAAIRRADKDPHVKAIVLRIDSPGGSATASDLISRAVEVAKKPVVASMGNVCASGGYFISAPCDKVFASNMTITGSIGVIFSAFNMAELFEKVGITADSCESGRFSKYFGAQGTITEWSDEFKTRIDEMIDNFYSDFVNVVAKGRGMQFDQAEKIARGRVWAGSDALALGLVDEAGGLQEAINAAAELAYLAPDAEVRAVDYPTVAMQVQDAAKRRGIIPSNLDEEGDEDVSSRKRRGWFRSSSKQDQEDEDSEEKLEFETEPAATVGATIWHQNFVHLLLSEILTRLDRFLLSTSSPTSTIVEIILGQAMSILRKDGAAAALSEEIERARAIAGRPAAIAPHLRIDD